MSTPFIGEIRMIAFNYATKGFALANGQSLSINQNQALFSLLGTTYGGNGQTTFQLPNLQGRSAMHVGTGFTLGQTGGEATHTLTLSEMPSHTHTAYVSTTGGLHPAAGNLPGNGGQALYDPTATGNAAMAAGVIGNAGSGMAHENRMPYLTVNFIIALVGIFPSRS